MLIVGMHSATRHGLVYYDRHYCSKNIRTSLKTDAGMLSATHDLHADSRMVFFKVSQSIGSQTDKVMSVTGECSEWMELMVGLGCISRVLRIQHIFSTKNALMSSALALCGRLGPSIPLMLCL